MGKITIWPKHDNDLNAHKSKIEDEHIPFNYMSDHSLLGLMVDEFHKAMDVLQQCESVNISSAFGAEVSFPCADQLQKIFEVLEDHGISFELSDIADQIYQG